MHRFKVVGGRYYVVGGGFRYQVSGIYNPEYRETSIEGLHSPYKMKRRVL